jgi:hypothetical protein
VARLGGIADACTPGHGQPFNYLINAKHGISCPELRISNRIQDSEALAS